MYRLIFAFCFFLQPAISHAQPYFQRMYGTANHNQVNTIVATADKGYLIVNRSYDGISSIIKTDSAGSIIWQKRYYTNGANYVHQIVDAVAAPGGYVVVMNTVDTSSVNGEYSEVNILKIDSVGNVIWSTSFIGDGQFGVVATRASCVIATTDGGFMITGSQWEIAATYHPQAMLAKLDQYGSLLWIKTYGIANNSAGWRLTEKLNGNFLVAGPAWGLSLSWNFVLETDSTGNGLWSKKYESWSSQGSDWNLGSLNDVIVTDDAGFVITGDPLVLIKCDSIGNVQWHKDTHWVWGNRVLQLQDGSYVVGGASMQGYPDNDALLARFDSTGSPLWWRRYGDATDNVALALVQTSGGYTLGGFTNGYNEDAYLVSVDSSGFGNCPFNISITDTTGNYTLTTGPSDGFGNATIESVNIPHVFVAVVTTDTTSEVICTCPMPVASFEIDTIVPGTYQFSSNSMNAVWNWDFGDGTYDTTAVALHTFDTLGLYTVCLNVTNNCGSDQTCINISYCQRPVSSFQIFMVDSSTIGLVDSSSFGDAWLWNFGDNIELNGIADTVFHTFESPGIYNVCLEVTNACDDSVVCENVTICLQPVAAFQFFIDDSLNGVTVEDSSIWATSLLWSYGDGISTSQVDPPLHIYELPGTYTICLTAFNFCSSDSVCQTVTIYTGVNGIDSEQYSIAPNPTDNFILVSTQNGFQRIAVQIVNTLGEIVLIADTTSGDVIDVSDLSSGLYMVRCVDLNGIVTSQTIAIH